jgi:methionyl-tRNA synthetase
MGGNKIGDARYIQFLGFDNSYFYVFVHAALAMAAQQSGYQWPLPSAFITNQFYYLNTGKFSTSKGHVIWARDMAAEWNTDLARLFLAWHGPEYQEGAFSEPIFRLAVAEFAGKINKLASAYNARRAGGNGHQATLPAKLIALMSRDVPMSEYSHAELARRSIHSLEYIESLLSSGRDAPIASIPAAVALCLGPFCPNYTDELKTRFNIQENSWANLAQCRTDASMPEIQEQYAHAHAL